MSLVVVVVCASPELTLVADVHKDESLFISKSSDDKSDEELEESVEDCGWTVITLTSFILGVKLAREFAADIGIGLFMAKGVILGSLGGPLKTFLSTFV